VKLSESLKRSLGDKAQRYAANLLATSGAPVLSYLLSRGISDEVAKMFGMGAVPHGEDHAGRLSIPYHTPNGVVQIKYRCTDPAHADHKSVDCPKYLYETGLGVRLYNAQALIRTPELVVVTEGELDAAVVQAYCGIPAVGYPGVETWVKQTHWPLCFQGVGDVVVVSDNDKVGKDSAHRVAESVRGRVLVLPKQYKDANEFIAAEGAAAFTERVSA
jgi:DNA primase